jgi:hypothetical protein
MSLFGGKKNPNLEQISHALHDSLGLTLIQPAEDVLRVLEGITPRELVNFNNAHSVEGMQELFRAKSIHAVVDPNIMAVSLFLLASSEIEKELKAEHTQVKVMHIAERHATQHIVKPPANVEPVKATTPTPVLPAVELAPVPPAFEHLEAVERLCPSIVDLFVKNGQLNTGDKEVLKKLLPLDSSLQARIVALERWQMEVTRRVRALSIPKATQHLVLGGEEAQKKEKPEEALARRFDSLIIWLGKLIKAFESTGVKFHNKPMWLPH